MPYTVIPGAPPSAYALVGAMRLDSATDMQTVASSHPMQYAAELTRSTKTALEMILDRAPWKDGR